jgi:hypothetical protein
MKLVMSGVCEEGASHYTTWLVQQADLFLDLFFSLYYSEC